MLTMLKTLGVSAALIGGTCLTNTEAQARHCCRPRCCAVQPTCCAPACAAPAATPAPAPATEAPPPPAEQSTTMRWDGQRYQSAYQPATPAVVPMRRMERRESALTEFGANRKFLGKFGE